MIFPQKLECLRYIKSRDSGVYLGMSAKRYHDMNILINTQYNDARGSESNMK